MSAEVESMMFTGRERPWHGLGTQVEGAPDSREALIAAGLDWDVVQRPVFTQDGVKVSGYFANVRQQDGSILGVVTSRYKVVQNRDAFAFTDDKMREHSLHIINKLHGMGFAIDMDDFGSGYSDLALLNQLPLDVMKIDRSLLVASEDSSRMQIVLRQMIDLGHALGMRVICEGIETEEQEQLLIACGCEYGQGFRYGRPMLPADYEDFLREHA